MRALYETMNKILISVGILVSFYAGYESGIYRERSSGKYYHADKITELIEYTSAYSHSINLNEMVSWDKIVESKNYEALKMVSENNMRERIKHLEGTNFSKSPFKKEIEASILNAKTYIDGK